MSADNAIFVQKNKAGEYVAQEGSMSSDDLPNPEEASIASRFGSLPEVIYAFNGRANETEYGFKFYVD